VPKAFGQKYHYLDHDSDVVDRAPPVQNQWYTVFDAEDVRLLTCVVYQKNDETLAKTIQVRWTIDGNVYLTSFSASDNTYYYIYRFYAPSTGGTGGLYYSTPPLDAARYDDKRGHNFKVEVRITSALGTNQILRCYCVRETLELT